MRNPFPKLKLLARLQRRKRADAATLTERIVATGADTGVSGGGDGLNSGSETLHSDRQQQQINPGGGNDTAVEVAPINSADEVNEPSCADVPVVLSATLETMPAKLRCQILSHLSDLEDLRALVLASPVFYHQYLLDRKALLGRALKATLGNYLADSYAVQTSAWMYYSANGPRTLEASDIRLFLENYSALRTAAPDVILEECIEEDLLDMAGFYHTLARPLVLQFAHIFCHRLDPSLQVGDLSDTERMRLLRALYRFQIYCNLFGAGTWGHRQVAVLEDKEGRLALFFCIFRPWEIEEIDCIYTLVSDKYDQVFDAIRWDVCRDHPKFKDWGRPDTPPGAFNLDNECELLVF